MVTKKGWSLVIWLKTRSPRPFWFPRADIQFHLSDVRGAFQLVAMSDSLETLLDLANARAERLKKARIEAENLLEQKSRELYAANQKLGRIQQNLQVDIKKATYELKVTNARLQTALDEKSAFIGQMSHEVRTPLNAIIGLSELLLESRLDDSQQNYINTINSGAKSMIVLINDLLDITKIEAGRVKIRPEPVDIHEQLHNIIGMFRLAAERQGLALDEQVNESVPSPISIDIGRYAQIINNLVSNAIKNTLKGKVSVSVSYTPGATDSDGVLITSVVDSGVGIEESQLERIFDAYEQIGRPGQGAGLGLSICRHLCDLMKGQISCESVPARGSIFRVELPIQTLSDLDLNVEPKAAITLPSLPPLKILVAEDNPINQKVLTAQLARLGQSAEMTSNGAEAMEKLSNERYDVVILDIQMPVMGGEQTLEKIRASEPGISSHYCIALTASSYQNQKARLLNLGFDAFLSKPLALHELGEALKNIPQSLSMSRVEKTSFIDWDSVVDTLEDEAFDFTFLKTQFGDVHRLIFHEIAPTFLDHCYKELDLLMLHVKAGDIEKIRKTSHSMKGAASSLGLSDLANILLRIENRPEAQDVAAKASEVQIYLQHLRPVIEHELARTNEESKG